MPARVDDAGVDQLPQTARQRLGPHAENARHVLLRERRLAARVDQLREVEQEAREAGERRAGAKFVSRALRACSSTSNPTSDAAGVWGPTHCCSCDGGAVHTVESVKASTDECAG